MYLEEINNLTLPSIVITCIVINYILISYFSINKKNYPIIMIIVGIITNTLVNGWINFTSTILAGAVSGLISVGMQTTFLEYISRIGLNRIKNAEKDNEEETEQKK